MSATQRAVERVALMLGPLDGAMAHVWVASTTYVVDATDVGGSSASPAARVCADEEAQGLYLRGDDGRFWWAGWV